MASHKKKTRQTNKNNKTKPENLMKKDYLESFEKLKKEIRKRNNDSDFIF